MCDGINHSFASVLGHDGVKKDSSSSVRYHHFFSYLLPNKTRAASRVHADRCNVSWVIAQEQGKAVKLEARKCVGLVFFFEKTRLQRD